MDQHTTDYIRRKLLEDGEFYFNSPIELVDLTFTLVYSGPLPAGQGRTSTVSDEQLIRRQLHQQLAQLWNTNRDLNRYLRAYHAARTPEHAAHYKAIGQPLFAQSSERGAFTFLPLVTSAQLMLCELDILFLRAEKKGSLFTRTHHSAGDLDNRIKVLFDALQVPRDASKIPATAVPEAGETPMFCLLEDDSLITAMRVESERLLTPSADPSDVRLVIRVTTKVEGMTLAKLGLTP